MEYGRNASRRNVADGIAGKGDGNRAEFVGHRICGSGAGQRVSAAVLRLARRVLLRAITGGGDIVDQEGCAGVRDVEGRTRAGVRCGPIQALVLGEVSAINDRAAAGEFLWTVRMVGAVY